uniref:Rho termination factor N-terminal domain-containing protein n=1 Tax=viral metagenome TaxID=1070528 RepID=A0A6C0DFX5_9ZZZZ
MTYLNDTLTIGLVLVLLFGSIALYLYTCIQQSEQKISLLESILLDIKMSGEIKSYTELPADDSASGSITPNNSTSSSHASTEDAYVPFEEEKPLEETDDTVIDVDGDLEDKLNEAAEYQAAVSEAIEEVSSSPKASDQKAYDSMSLKELQALAKSRGIMGLTKKGPLIEALKTSDRSQVKPGSISAVGTNSFLESSASVSDESA